MADYDAMVVGSGPNGLAAAITLARAQHKVLLIEAKSILGGGMRSKTIDGFTHDICSAIHPLTLASPFFREIMPELEQRGLEWVYSPAELAHPLEHDTVLLYRSLEDTAASLGVDAAAYRQLFTPLLRNWQGLLEETLAPLLHLPKAQNLMTLAHFGARALSSASMLQHIFTTEAARALWAGLAAHSILPLHTTATSAIGLMLGLTAHSVGWGFPKGGAQRLADSMVAYFKDLGGTIITDAPLDSLAQLGVDYPSADTVFLNTDAQQVLRLAKGRLPHNYQRWLQRFRYGAAAFKVDYALNAPIPWRHTQTNRAATVHLGGNFASIAASERWLGTSQHSHASQPTKPYVLVAQHSLFDNSRAPEHQHTAWVYCHVPHGSTIDMQAAIRQQISHYAPDFPDTIIHEQSMNPQAYQYHNPNYVGGDINAGIATLWQMLARPTLWNPYIIPLQNTKETRTRRLNHAYLCSASTPPGGGVHGMAGYLAAQLHIQKMHGVNS